MSGINSLSGLMLPVSNVANFQLVLGIGIGNISTLATFISLEA